MFSLFFFENNPSTINLPILYLQENRGFKACEASQQADYESTDDISNTCPRGENSSYCWDINDLILFVDSDDNPRIPKKLFDDVCQIRVAGSPGPVYRSLLQATGKFLMIVCFLVFVFIVVLSFGDTYKISSTNQVRFLHGFVLCRSRLDGCVVFGRVFTIVTLFAL